MRAALPLVFLAGLAACSGQDSAPNAEDASTGAPSSVAGSAACDVLTRAAAEKALGRAADKLASDGGPAGLDICQYGYQGEKLMDTGNVSVTVQPLDLASVKAGAEAQGYKLEPVGGLGEAAYYSPEIGLYVGKGNRTAIYLVGVGGEEAAKTKERAIALARDTIGRL